MPPCRPLRKPAFRIAIDVSARPEADGQIPSGRPRRQHALHFGRRTAPAGRVPHQGPGRADLTPEQGYQAARQVGLAILATLRANLGSLDKVKRLVKTFGLVLCTPEFTEQPKVMNGFSELMAERSAMKRASGCIAASGPARCRAAWRSRWNACLKWNDN